LVSGPAVKGGYAVAARFASLTLDRRPGDQDWLVIGEAEEFGRRFSSQTIKAFAGPISMIPPPFISLLR